MKTKKKFQLPCIVMAIWLLILLLSISVIHSSISSGIREKVMDTELVLSSTASKVEYSINSRLLNLRTLEVLVRHDKGMLCDFEKHAAWIYESDPCVRCIQLAPNGVITHIYPLEGNENAYGNLFVNTLRREEARYARDSGEMTMGGPYELHQGGVGMVARRPIYMRTDEGEPFFWGLAIEVLDLPMLLEAAETEALTENGYSYRFWHYAPQTGEPAVFAGEEYLPDSPLTAEIAVPGGTWYLSLVPTAGWFSAQMLRSGLSVFAGFNLLTLLLAFAYISLAKSRERLGLASVTDPLTGAGNARSFYETLGSLSENQTPHFIYYLDLNKFKQINDTYGHAVGNALLCSFADRIRATATTTDTFLFRIGGDEFSIIKLGADLSDARKYREDLYRSMSEAFTVDGFILPVTSSIGFAAYPEESANAEKVIRLAESRMYEEKARASQPVALNSRSAFFNALSSKIYELLAQDTDQSFYFFHIDYKNFKLINYRYGLDAGDELIKRSVSYVNSLPECVLCSRGYADWIFFVTREPSGVSRGDIADRFMDYYEQFIREEQKNFPDICLSCNCGFTMIVDNDIKTAAGRANIGRLISKQQLTVRPVYVDMQSADAWMSEKSFESAVLLAAAQRNIYYELQPIMSASEEKMAFAEALGRLRDSDGKTIAPNDFVPILTRSGGIALFDFYILECVCRDIRARLDAGKPVVPISVNFSPLHLEDSRTADIIRDILTRYGVPSEMIIIEITEDMLISDTQRLPELCRELHDMGIRVMPDDFGAGYLNFDVLRTLPIDAIKIDKSLVPSGDGDLNREKSILSKIFSITSDLHISVICEGVEKPEQRLWLQELGADYLQGYYYARPSDPEVIYEKFCR